MAKPTYGCTQPELYTTCRNSWLLCQQYLPEFADYKSKYTAALIAENLTLLDSVEAMPDLGARNEPVKGLRMDLMKEKADATTFYIRLKGYVAEAFKDEKTVQEARYTDMGQSYYEKLSAGNWEDVSGLFKSMLGLVKTHQAVLTTKGYMPTAFLTRLEDKETSFLAAHQSWSEERSANPTGTETKIVANNDLKLRVMEMLADGQAAFCDRKKLAQKFVWRMLLTDVRGVKPTGFSGKTIDTLTEVPLSNATVSIESLGKTVTCDKDGRFQLILPTADACTLIFKAEGYQTLVVADRNVKMGVMGRLNVKMEAVA